MSPLSHLYIAEINVIEVSTMIGLGHFCVRQALIGINQGAYFMIINIS